MGFSHMAARADAEFALGSVAVDSRDGGLSGLW
jgi:hypothetical protein